MKIIFKKIRFKNFLSSGNFFIEIDLNTHNNTLIKGFNGVGKSIFLDSICFCLFGKPYRNINKPTLVNSINEKDLLVEGEIEIGKNTYLIRRGIKPNIFELYVNGTLLNQTASSKDYQEYLENHILKINFKSFTQILVLGSSIYVPFMELTAAHRREIIEDVLDISVFSNMNTMVKADSNKNKSDLEFNNRDIVSVQDKIKLVKSHIEELEQYTDSRKSEFEAQLNVNTKEILDIQSNIDRLEKQIGELEDQTKKYSLIENMYTNLNTSLMKANYKFQELNKDIDFYNSNNVCSVCNQSIDIAHKQKQIESLEEKRNKCIDIISHIENKKKIVKSESDKLDVIFNTIEKLSNELDKNEHEKQLKIKFSDRIKANIEKEEKIKTVKQDNSTLKTFEDQLKILEEQKQKLMESKTIIETTSVLLKDNGIKSVIIKNYIPIINQLINKYLKSMGFNVNFNLNENFEETIKSRFRDTFTYQNFSEGEKQRINLALLFAWRQIAKIKSSININLLIMDEIFDSSLDEKGMECLYKLLKTKEIKDNSNIYIISHKKDLSEDFFDRLVTVDKINNFTRYNIKDNKV